MFLEEKKPQKILGFFYGMKIMKDRKKPGYTRRNMLKKSIGLGGIILGMPFINLGQFQLFASTTKKYSRKAIDLVTESLVMDMLSPLSLDLTGVEKGIYNEKMDSSGDGLTDQEIQDYRDSGINVFHIAVGTGGRNQTENKISSMTYVSLHNSLISNHPDVFMRIDSVKDLDKVQKNGKVGILIGLQNSAHFISVDDVELFYNLGQRVSQLTYNNRNLIGNGSTERVDGGITDFGVQIIEKMNKIGMAVDVSHCGDKTTLDSFEVSKKPVLITHSNVRNLTPGHPRCKTDEAIKAMAKCGGVMGLTAVRNFVKPDEPTTIEHYLDQFDYLRDMVGVEHIGVGSDIDLHGYDDLSEEWNKQLRSGYKDSYAFRDKLDIEGVDHPKRMFDLTEGLIKRGYSNKHIKGILGQNFKRAFTEIWAN